MGRQLHYLLAPLSKTAVHLSPSVLRELWGPETAFCGDKPKWMVGGYCSSFSIKRNASFPQSFEYCYWRHNDQLCEFEWKRAHWDVKKGSCKELTGRVKYVGNYERHECKMELSNVTQDDHGTWIWAPSVRTGRRRLEDFDRRLEFSLNNVLTMQPIASHT